MNRSVSTYVIGAIDICLWDINGKIANQPIHRLLGTCKESVPVYSSTAFHETKEQYAEEALIFKLVLITIVLEKRSLPGRSISSIIVRTEILPILIPGCSTEDNSGLMILQLFESLNPITVIS